MKCHTKAILLLLLLATAKCPGQGTTIDIINNSQDWLLIFRVGDPDTTVTVQKRWDQTITLPLAAGAPDTLQAIEIAREGTSITNSETSFSGFSGNFAQNCTITVQQAGISISYASESTSSTNQTSQPSNSTPSDATTAAGGTIGGGGGYPGGGYGNNAFRAPNNGAKTGTPDDYGYGSNAPVKTAPLKKNVLAGASGVRVKVTSPVEGKMPPLEAPSPARVRSGKAVLEPIPTLSTLPPEPPKRKQNGYYIVFAAIVATIIIFIGARMRESRSSRRQARSRPAHRANALRM
jgi:hypothetical protein